MPKIHDEQDNPPRFDMGGLDLLSNASAQRTTQLIGFRASGKTSFYLKEMDRVAHIIYRDMYNEELVWKDKPSKDRTDEVSARICMRVLDCDVEGVAKLLKRPHIAPPPLINNESFRKWKIVGPSKLINDERTEFEVANDALVTFLGDMKQHNAKYPDYQFARFLVLENEGSLYQIIKDYYVKIVDPSPDVMDITDLYLKSRKVQQRTGKFVVEFPQGPRETFGKGIYPLLLRFFKALVTFTDDYGFNVYSTVLLTQKTKDYGKPSQHDVVEPTGKPDITQQFFDYIIWLFKKVEQTDVNDPYSKTAEYWADTTTYGKNRSSPDIIVPVTHVGPTAFWNAVNDAVLKERQAWEAGKVTPNIMGYK